MRGQTIRNLLSICREHCQSNRPRSRTTEDRENLSDWVNFFLDGMTKRMIDFPCPRDNPDVDIAGANMYHSYLQQDPEERTSISGYDLIADETHLSARSCESVLVCTGVYDPEKCQINNSPPWKRPTVVRTDVLEAVKYILIKENCSWN